MATDSFETAPAVLGTWPTPLEAAPGWLRRSDWAETTSGSNAMDLTGLGGGGTTRCASWSGSAVPRLASWRRTPLVTCGARQSNPRPIDRKLPAATMGLDVVLVLAGAKVMVPAGRHTSRSTGCWAPPWRGPATLLTKTLRPSHWPSSISCANGAPVRSSSLWGSSALGARGYVECGDELLRQAEDLSQVCGPRLDLVAPWRASCTRSELDECSAWIVGAIRDPGSDRGRTGRRPRGALLPQSVEDPLDQVGGWSTANSRPGDGCVDVGSQDRRAPSGPDLQPVAALAGWSVRSRSRDHRRERIVFLHSGGPAWFFGHRPLSRARLSHGGVLSDSVLKRPTRWRECSESEERPATLRPASSPAGRRWGCRSRTDGGLPRVGPSQSERDFRGPSDRLWRHRRRGSRSVDGRRLRHHR